MHPDDGEQFDPMFATRRSSVPNVAASSSDDADDYNFGYDDVDLENVSDGSWDESAFDWDQDDDLSGFYADEQGAAAEAEGAGEQKPPDVKGGEIRSRMLCGTKDGAARLREPLPLFSTANKDAVGPQHTVHWPAPIELILPGPQHIRHVPQAGEPFFEPKPEGVPPSVLGPVSAMRRNSGSTGSLMKATGSAVRMNRVVFESDDPSKRPEKFHRNQVRSRSKPVAPYYEPKSPDDMTLVFESRFESGNLFRAVQVGEWEYDLTLKTDLYTSRHTQWFYFSVRNARARTRYRFNIVNFMKQDSLYAHGLRPLIYSDRDAEDANVGWVRGGDDVRYFRNGQKVYLKKADRPLFTMSFTYEFRHVQDTVFFAHCYPYTYTDLQRDLARLCDDPARASFCRRRVLCRTLCGNACDMLTVTAFASDPKELAARKGVVVTARVHPGETNGSWMMRGLLEFLTGESPEAQRLRTQFVFKIVPMLNPDGVIVGNYRCSLAGVDLNRRWRSPARDKHPTVFHAKQMALSLARSREVALYCDLHGHSRKADVFMYGCDDIHNASSRFLSRVFPRVMTDASPDVFSFSSCKFRVQRSKESTARVVMWQEGGIQNSYTMEASFCGALLPGRSHRRHFTTADLEGVGRSLCLSLLKYTDPTLDVYSAYVARISEEMLQRVMRLNSRAKGGSVNGAEGGGQAAGGSEGGDSLVHRRGSGDSDGHGEDSGAGSLADVSVIIAGNDPFDAISDSDVESLTSGSDDSVSSDDVAPPPKKQRPKLPKPFKPDLRRRKSVVEDAQEKALAMRRLLEREATEGPRGYILRSPRQPGVPGSPATDSPSSRVSSAGTSRPPRESSARSRQPMAQHIQPLYPFSDRKEGRGETLRQRRLSRPKSSSNIQQARHVVPKSPSEGDASRDETTAFSVRPQSSTVRLGRSSSASMSPRRNPTRPGQAYDDAVLVSLSQFDARGVPLAARGSDIGEQEQGSFVHQPDAHYIHGAFSSSRGLTLSSQGVGSVTASFDGMILGQGPYRHASYKPPPPPAQPPEGAQATPPSPSRLRKGKTTRSRVTLPISVAIARPLRVSGSPDSP